MKYLNYRICIFLIIFVYGSIVSVSQSDSTQNEKDINKREWNKVSKKAINKKIKFYKSILKDKGVSFDSSAYPIGGMVPNAETALKLAGIYLNNIYGRKTYLKLSVVAENIGDSIWRIAGIAPPTCLGGPIIMDIEKRTGKVLGYCSEK